MAQQRVTITDVYNQVEKLRKEVRDSYITKDRHAVLEEKVKNLDWYLKLVITAVVPAIIGGGLALIFKL